MERRQLNSNVIYAIASAVKALVCLIVFTYGSFCMEYVLQIENNHFAIIKKHSRCRAVKTDGWSLSKNAQTQ